MAVELDFNSVDEKVKEVRDNFLFQIEKKAFVREEFDYRRYQMDLAIKQEFLDAGLSSGTYREYNLSEEDIETLSGVQLEDLSDFQRDAYSDLYLPLMLTFFRAFVTGMSNLCFPANGDWLDLKRTTSGIFEDTPYEDFLPFVNDAWVDIIKTENQRHGVKEVYKSAMAECIKCGNSFLGHSYDPHNHYVAPYVPGIGQCGIWPLVDNWKKSNLVFYYDVNYAELVRRAEQGEFDPDIVKMIEPSMEGRDASSSADIGATRQAEYTQHHVPYGKVRIHEFFIPTFFAKGSDNTTFTAENMQVTAVLQAKINMDEDDKELADELQKERILILNTNKDLTEDEHGFLFYKFATGQPGVFYQQGPLQPFLPHQYVANQMMSEASRLAGYMGGSPRSMNRADGGIISPEETPQPDFEANALYENVKFEMAFNPAELSQAIRAVTDFLQYVERVFQEGVGISKDRLGILHQGRKTATEVKEAYSGGQMNMVEAAGSYDEQVLRPSITTRIRRTQQILKQQVESAALDRLENDPSSLEPTQVMIEVLNENALFQRLMDYSGIKKSYKEYLKKKQKEMLQDQEIVREVQDMAGQIEQMIMFADSPIVPPPPIPQKVVNGNVVPPAGEIQALKQRWVQEQQKQRHEVREKAKDLEMDMKIKELTFSETEQPPPPSSVLFYQMLTAPIADSDVVVTGSMTTVSKELARENTLTLLNFMKGFPETTLKKIDFDSILQILGRANDTPLKDMLKDQATIMREEEQAKKEAEYQRQIEARMLENPGAQPPQE